MFLTTEPSLAGKNYNALRVIFATVTLDASANAQRRSTQLDTAIENALGKLYANAMNLGADGIIGIHVSIADSGWVSATVMGTAIKIL